MAKRKNLAAQIIIIIILLLAAMLAVFPFVIMGTTSLQELYTMKISFNPQNFNLHNFTTIFKNYNFGRYFYNSSVVVICACFFNIVISSLAGFAFAKKRFRAKKALFTLYLATMMVPGQVTLIPAFSIMNKLNLLNTYLALFLPVINAFGVFLFRQFMMNIPDELLESARIDGSGEVRTYLYIVIPLVKSVIISLTVFTFISSWNDFLWPLITTTSDSMSTLTVALSTLNSNYRTNYGLVMAGAMLTFLPPFIIYIFLQKQFVQGIALSGIKA